MILDIFEINYSKMESSRFNVNDFAKENQDLYNKFTKKTVIKQLSII